MPVVPSTMEMIPTYQGSGGVTAANVLHFLNAGGDFDQATCDEILQNWDAFWAQQASNQWACDDDARFVDLRTDPPDEIFGTNTGSTGVVTGGVLPANVAACVSLSGGGGRRRAGRIYLPGIAEASITDGSRLDPTFIASILGDLITFVQDTLSEAGWLLAVYSRVNGTSAVVQSISVDTVVDTQRRRSARLA